MSTVAAGQNRDVTLAIHLDPRELERVAREGVEAGMTREEYAREAVIRYGDLVKFEKGRVQDHFEIMELVDDAMTELRRLARPRAFAEGAMPFLTAMERLARRTGREPILETSEE